MAFKTYWMWRGPQLSNRWAAVGCYATDEYPHPSIIENAVCPSRQTAFSLSTVDASGNLVVVLLDDQNASAPDLWYVLEEASFPVDMVTIYAVSSNHFPNGTVVAVEDIKDVVLSPMNHVGFIRWFRKDSKIQQIFVSENWRRKRVSTTLFSIADIVITAGRYGSYLNGGDVTTSDGEILRQAWSTSTRVTPRIGSVDNHLS